MDGGTNAGGGNGRSRQNVLRPRGHDQAGDHFGFVDAGDFECSAEWDGRNAMGARQGAGGRNYFGERLITPSDAKSANSSTSARVPLLARRLRTTHDPAHAL
jgi:hypothetical protein